MAEAQEPRRWESTSAPTHPVPSPSPNPIAELQQVFGTLLLVTRDKPKHPTPKTIPRWTGSFRLFDFPREMRDRIYHYALHSPSGVVYRRSRAHTRTWPFEDTPRTQLFLSSRQVYSESLQVFCRETVVRITFRSQLSGTLRLFPDQPARLLQRIKLEYRSHWQLRGVGNSWGDMITQARLAKEFFPLLRECTAVWHVDEYVLEKTGLDFKDKTVEEQTEVWAEALRSWYEGNKLVPPRWLRVELVAMWGYLHASLQASFHAALDGFRREVEAMDRHGTENDLESSGRKWLETWGGGKGRKKRSRG
ncbi:hypothetical protein K505DRAFT_369892 [Melanomma pulvis-pyrius CBS 109.77]|uniref:Uncharacterized protein n=1 Tax=Melanomma pulvis-pyrius CBS 109.77 TaxID=1314802 RepID=A0A6A6XWV5_9PLEO|nr:hypothetical protein K505DRAFT_369892 [Melanomma pulvis-pyrius CBS 109.77]